MIQIEFISPKKNAEIVRSVNGQIGDVVLDIPKIDGLATEEYVAKKIAEAQMEGADIDLSDYYTKSEVDAAIEEIELTPGEPGKDYVLTEEDKAEIAGMVEVSGADVDLSDYYTKNEVDGLIPAVPVKAGTGTGSVMGLNAKSASGTDSFAFGTNAEATNYAIAIGAYAKANATYGAMAIGTSAQATSGMDAMAVGNGAKAKNSGAMAVGKKVTTSQSDQFVIGKFNVDDSAPIIIGNGTEGANRNAMTVDADNVAHFPGNVKIGADDAEVATKAYVDEAVANAGGSGEGGSVSVDGTTIVQNEDGTISATAPIKAGFGQNSVMTLEASSASGSGSLALGSYSNATSDCSVAIGPGTRASSDYATTIGAYTRATQRYQCVTGCYNANDSEALFIVGVGSGIDENERKNGLTIDVNQVAHFPGSVVVGADKAEVATKAFVDEAVANAGGSGSVSVDGTTIVQNEDGTISATAPIKAGTGTSSIMTSNANSASNLRSLAIGYNASSSGAQAMAVGSNTEASAASAIAIGLYTKATFDSAIGIGSSVEATGKNSLALGHSAKTANNGSYAIGSGAQATNQDTMAIGHNSKATADSAYAFGTYVTADTAKQMVIGRHNVSDPTATFIIGNGANTIEQQNAMVIDSSNAVNFPGSVTIGADKAEVATKAFVEELLGVIENGNY